MASRDGAVAGVKIVDRRFLALAGMEFWERFAMYGVKSLLVLSLVDRVLASDLTQVIGATALRDASAAMFGSISRAALASQLYGYANALIYLAIPAGGWIGDRIGDRRALVTGGAIGMLLGLAMMLSDRSFLIGLIPFAVGTGVLKGNLSAQLGLLFHDEAQRRRGYTIYLGFLNAGVIGGPLACGVLATLVGPISAIAAAAAAVAAGLTIYRLGDTEDATPGPAAGLPSVDLPDSPAASTTVLVVALTAVYLCFAAYEQLGNVFLIWARTRVDLQLAGWTMPVGWFLSLDGVMTLSLIAISQWATQALERRGMVLRPMTQITLGGMLCAAGYLVLAVGSATAGSSPLPLPWALSYLLLVDAAIVLIWPAGLSLIAGVAPRRQLGLWMGLFYLHGFVANLWAGFSGMYVDRMATPDFWLLHAGVAGAGASLALVAGMPLMRTRERQAITTLA
nr:MFS transporter [Sphingomonas sp. GC_Shp_5]